MPGCIGIDNGGADYCAFPEHLLNATADQTQVPWQNGFQIKLYWEEGYLWQNETFERKQSALLDNHPFQSLTGSLPPVPLSCTGEWCVYYNYDGFPGTGLCCKFVVAR